MNLSGLSKYFLYWEDLFRFSLLKGDNFGIYAYINVTILVSCVKLVFLFKNFLIRHLYDDLANDCRHLVIRATCKILKRCWNAWFSKFNLLFHTLHCKANQAETLTLYVRSDFCFFHLSINWSFLQSKQVAKGRFCACSTILPHPLEHGNTYLAFFSIVFWRLNF